MAEVDQMAQAYQELGVYAILAVLTFAVVYLYRSIEHLRKEAYQDTKSAVAETAKIATQASSAIAQCAQSLTKMNESLDSLRVDVAELRSKFIRK